MTTTTKIPIETNATNDRLRAVLEGYGLSTSGNKAALRLRVATINHQDGGLIDHCRQVTETECPVTVFDGRPADAEAVGVNLDGEDSADLMKFWAWLGASGGCSRDRAAFIFPARPKGYRAVVDTLKGYAANKATAMNCRARGDIAAAQVYETICERLYEELPEWARW